MSAGRAFEYVLEIGEWLDVVELGGCDERADGCPAVCTAIGPGKEMVLAAERDGPDGALYSVGVEFDTPIIKEAAEIVPTGQGYSGAKIWYCV